MTGMYDVRDGVVQATQDVLERSPSWAIRPAPGALFSRFLNTA